ncbi:MAG TPA: hypothetical protein DCP05_05810 [Rhodospirillaceae bacterium]|nr:hypothetical protein [Rhodospirillaceae bacterium]
MSRISRTHKATAIMVCALVTFGGNRVTAGGAEQIVADGSVNGALQMNGTPSLLGYTGHTIFFDFDSVELDEFAIAVITSVIEATLANPASKIVIRAHTDSSGPSAYNEELSHRRAEAVKQAIRDRGMKDVIILVEGLGESMPFIVTGDGIREPQNRRAEISLKTIFGAVSENEKPDGGKDEMHEDSLQQDRLLQNAVLEKTPEQETAFQEGQAKPQMDRIPGLLWEGWLKEVRLHDWEEGPRLHHKVAAWFRGHLA